MRVVVQRVKSASVAVEGDTIGQIGRGLLVLAGFTDGDGPEQLDWMAKKLIGLRIFEDADGKMNLAVGDVEGSLLLVPNFTLYADCRKGRRPGFSEAADPAVAEGLFAQFCTLMQELPVPVAKGDFGSYMQVSLENDGPVTLVIDSPD
jgi:D-aminoacyl-tRNA deacylase